MICDLVQDKDSWRLIGVICDLVQVKGLMETDWCDL